MVETQRPERLPLDLTLEAHIPADRSSYRLPARAEEDGLWRFLSGMSGGLMRDILPVVVDGLWRPRARKSGRSSGERRWATAAGVDARRPYRPPSPLRADPSVFADRQPGQNRIAICSASPASRSLAVAPLYSADTLRPGQPLMISAPRNHFPLHEGGHVVLLAAGIGITPLLAMAHARRRPAPALRCTITSAAQEAAFATGSPASSRVESARSTAQTRAESAPAAGAGSGAPDADTRVYFCGPPGFYGLGSRYRAGGRMGGRNCTAKRSSRPPRRRRRRRTEPSPSPSPPPGSAGRCRGTKPSPRCCRDMALRCRSPARWGSAAPA